MQVTPKDKSGHRALMVDTVETDILVGALAQYWDYLEELQCAQPGGKQDVNDPYELYIRLTIKMHKELMRSL